MRLRLVLATLATIACFWLLAQVTVATWLAQAAIERGQAWAQGRSPWQWDFSAPGSVVHAGSHGINLSQRESDALALTLPDDGAASLSLALRGEWLDLQAVDRARIALATDAPLRLWLLPMLDDHAAPWLHLSLTPGQHDIEPALAPLVENRVAAIQLRLEAAPGSHVNLHRIALLGPPCGDAERCATHIESLPPRATPESILALRDARNRQAPAVSLTVGGLFGSIGNVLAAHLPRPGRIAGLVLAAGLSLLALHGLWRRLRPAARPASPRRCALELLACLGPAFALLLAGWPARDTPLAIALLLALCLLALLALPAPETRRWQVLGAAASWRHAATFTLALLLLTLPLPMLRSEPVSAPDAALWLRYPLWALIQQWLLIGAIMPRVRRFSRNQAAAALTGGILFALMHAPNFSLMLFTLVGGIAWAFLGQRDRALLPLVTSHAVLGLWLVHTTPHWLLRSAEIGGRYLMTP